MKRNEKEKGQGLTEYAVILSLVAVASIVCMALFGGAVKGKISALTAAVSGQTKAEVQQADSVAKSYAKQADTNAKAAKGNMDMSEDVVDSLTASGN
jgi:Flp pilus assembly pilin Flp